MGHSQYDPMGKARRSWNAGRTVGAKRALKPQQVWAIRFWLDSQGRLRDGALFDLAIDSKLRGCDVVRVKIGDLVSGGRIRTRAIAIQRKTKRPVQFELLEPARTSLLAGTARRHDRRLRLPQPHRSRDPYQHAPVRSPRRRTGDGDWTSPGGLRHPFASADESVHHLQGDR